MDAGSVGGREHFLIDLGCSQRFAGIWRRYGTIQGTTKKAYDFHRKPSNILVELDRVELTAS